MQITLMGKWQEAAKCPQVTVSGSHKAPFKNSLWKPLCISSFFLAPPFFLDPPRRARGGRVKEMVEIPVLAASRWSAF